MGLPGFPGGVLLQALAMALAILLAVPALAAQQPGSTSVKEKVLMIGRGPTRKSLSSVSSGDEVDIAKVRVQLLTSS